MSLGNRLTLLARRLPLPRRTIRLRLAVLYGSLFFLSGAALLGITYAAVSRTHGAYSSQAFPAPIIHTEVRGAPSGASPSGVAGLREKMEGAPPASLPGGAAVRVFDAGQHGADVRVLAFVSLIALVAMAALSMGLGWLVAGRVLRPLRTITGAAREISATDLHRRLALTGPDDEFKELGDTFDGLLGRLEASFAAQRQFVANASHELRTPLARLKTLAQVALADPNASVESLRAAHDRVLASEQQLEQLIDALLSLARGERGLERRQPVDLAALAGDAIEERFGEIERRGLQLHTALNPARIQGDWQLLERLVANLIDNAIRHNVAGGGIDVSTTTAAGDAVLSVANDGPAVPDDELERLQAPFERHGAARTGSGDGHGLGLSIVQAIVAAHEAQLIISARPKGGLAVEVRFPPSI
ncbi:MAG TPA: ATP-binding protein [Solirubrobacteraceae bacterium]|nr:ATP-binding protein [Solirubrobacteraceae bacterium]